MEPVREHRDAQDLDLRTLEVELFGATTTSSPGALRRAPGAPPTPARTPRLLIEFLAFPEDLPRDAQVTLGLDPDPASGPPRSVPDLRAAAPRAGRALDPDVEAAYFDPPPARMTADGVVPGPDDQSRPPSTAVQTRSPGRWRRRSIAVTWGAPQRGAPGAQRKV